MRLEFIERRSRLDESEKEYRDAKAYLHRAKQFLTQGQDHSVVFNVASLALERYLVALCYLHKMEPYNHNYECLMDTVEMVIDVPAELNKEIRSMDNIFDICSLDDYHHGEPEPLIWSGFCRCAKQLRDYLNRQNVIIKRNYLSALKRSG